MDGFTMSVNDIRDEILEICGKSAYIVYLIILSHRNQETGKCFPSYDVIMREAHCVKTTLQTALSSLCDNGFLIINSGTKGWNNTYFFPREEFFEVTEETEKAHRRKGNKKREDDS